MSIIDMAVARAASNRDNLGEDLVPAAEAMRIIDIPVVTPPEVGSPEMNALVRKWTDLLKRPGVGSPRPLLWPQAWAFESMHRQAQSSSPIGLAGNLGVGSGKTLIDMLAGHKAVFGAQRTLVLTKSSLIDEMNRERLDWSKDYAIPPFQPMSYGALSSKKGTNRLSLLRPDLVVCDEGHLLRYLDSARTGRFIRYFNENPTTRLVIITGTFMSTTMMDMLHLLYLALREGSPAPHPESNEAKTWASCIDESSTPFAKDFYDLEPVVDWSGRSLNDRASDDEDVIESNKEVCRAAFFDRIASTPGFVFTSAPSCSEDLFITADRSVPIVGPIESALAKLRDYYQLPNDEEVLDSLAMARAARQLSMGFYMRWAWEKTPEGVEDKPWTEARKTWAGACRWWLKSAGWEGVDSPGLVQDAVIRGDLQDPVLVSAWERWAAQRMKPEPPTEVVWIDMAPLIRAYDWLEIHRQNKSPALLWWESTSAIRPVLESFGVRTFGAGDSTNRLRQELVAAPSQRVFGTGFNGQKFTHHFILEPPSNPSTLEQLLGRSHRTGREGAVYVDVAAWAWPQTMAWAKAFRRAKVLQTTMGQQQRVLHAKLKGFPEIVDDRPCAFLDNE